MCLRASAAVAYSTSGSAFFACTSDFPFVGMLTIRWICPGSAGNLWPTSASSKPWQPAFVFLALPASILFAQSVQPWSVFDRSAQIRSPSISIALPAQPWLSSALCAQS